MKKVLSLFLIFVFCFGLCACGNEAISRTEYEKEEYETKEEIWVMTDDNEYNEDGNILTSIKNMYNKDGELVSKESIIHKWNVGSLSNYTYEYDFDQQNNLTEVRALVDGVVKDVFTFNSDGSITEFASYDSGGQTDYKVYEYDENGNLLSSVDYNESGDLDEKILYEYREDGTCEKFSCYNEGDVLLYITECDETGWSCFTQYYNETAPSYDHKFEYDSYGNVTEKIDYFADSTQEQSHHKYTYKKIFVTPLQKMIIEAKNKLLVWN